MMSWWCLDESVLMLPGTPWSHHFEQLLPVTAKSAQVAKKHCRKLNSSPAWSEVQTWKRAHSSKKVVLYKLCDTTWKHWKHCSGQQHSQESKKCSRIFFACFKTAGRSMKSPSGNLQRLPVHALRPCITLADDQAKCCHRWPATSGYGSKNGVPNNVPTPHEMRFTMFTLCLPSGYLT